MDYKCDKCERNLKDHDKKKVIMEALKKGDARGLRKLPYVCDEFKFKQKDMEDAIKKGLVHGNFIHYNIFLDGKRIGEFYTEETDSTKILNKWLGNISYLIRWPLEQELEKYPDCIKVGLEEKKEDRQNE